MKNKIYSSLLLSTLLLAGCQSETPAPEDNEETTNDDTTEQVTDENETDAEDAETEQDDENVDEENMDEEPEEVSYQYQINPNTFAVEPIEGEESDEKLVLLTFDDAPYGNAMEIAEALDERDVRAIFFVNGMYMEDEEGFETMQEIHEMGFEIANHTHTHAKLDDYSESDQLEEITKTNDIIEEAIGKKPRFFRAPHGVMTDYASQAVADEGMTWMNWSFGYDWNVEYQDAAALTEVTLNGNDTDGKLLGPGANILMHDREWTADAVPAIVDGLIEQGFTIVDPSLIINENE